eukprot:COSAG01_NODE_5846_length_3999_cov_3.807179_2_plen_181_part_00
MVHTLHALMCSSLFNRSSKPSQKPATRAVVMAAQRVGRPAQRCLSRQSCHLLFSAVFSACGALRSFALRVVCPCSRKLEGLEGLSSVTIVPPLSSHATTESDALAASPRMLQYPMKSHRCSSQLRAGGRATCGDSLSMNRMVVCSACSCRRERSLSPSSAAAGGSPHAAQWCEEKCSAVQ